MLLGCKSIAIVFPFQSLRFSLPCSLPSSCFEIEKDAHSFRFSLSTSFLSVFNRVRRLLLRKRELFLLLSRNKDASKKEECTPSFHFISLYIDSFLYLIFSTSTTGCKDLITSSNSFWGVLTPRRLLTVEK